LILENKDAEEKNTVTVFRSRMGEWGEYFEKWSLVDGKPKKVKEGWN
jgi:hypothetical protein